VSEREDALLERVLQQVDHPGLEDPGLDLRGDERRVWREYGELAAVLPAALDPIEPPPHVLAKILASVRDDTKEMEDAAAARASRRTGANPVAERRTRRRVEVLGVAAAGLAALALGLGAMAGWLASDRARQLDAIASLEQRLQTSAGRDRALAQAQVELEHLRSVVTSAGMRACPLRPFGEHPPQPWARAVVYFDGDHHQYYLVARDLEPCRQGARYVLWFLVDGKPVPAGSFRPEKGVPVALGSEEAPGSTRGAFLTLESDPAVKRPTGTPILYGESAEEML
jgi:hypothetical protein